MAKQLSHAQLQLARLKLGKPKRGDPVQQRLAAAEHQAFAREAVAENPLMALPLLAATPGYYLAKKFGQATGLDKRIPFLGGTAPDLAQLAGGYTGIREGLRSRFGLDKPSSEVDSSFTKRREGREVLATFKPKRKRTSGKGREELAMNSKTISHQGYGK